VRVLLASNASYEFLQGGSTRSNLVWIRHLVAAGHEVRVVCAAPAERREPDVERLYSAGLPILSVRDLARRPSILSNEIRGFQPDWVLVSSEDLGHTLLREAYRAAPDRLVYLAHTPQFYPFGPASWNPDQQAAAIVWHAVAVIAVGHHTADYIERYCGRRVEVIHPPIYGQPPFARFGSVDRGLIVMINPCAVKGLSIFLALAERFPQCEFGALVGWGTTSEDRAAIARRPNVRLLAPVKNIEEVFSQSRLLLMPSLWYEGFGLTAMEAMLRGLPAVTSNSGGLVESKADTGFVIPVHQITQWEPLFDEMHMPVPLLPDEDIELWTEALGALLCDRIVYETESELSRQVALRFVSGLHLEDFEAMLKGLHKAAAPDPIVTVDDRIQHLSPERRELLLRRLRQRRGR
jgi:glycosyltransferase involved in cell wall biosynthesis